MECVAGWKVARGRKKKGRGSRSEGGKGHGIKSGKNPVGRGTWQSCVLVGGVAPSGPW